MKIGTNDISKIYLGSAEIEKIYLGTEQVFGGEPTPVPFEEQYLTFVASSDNMSVGLKYAGSNVFQYSTDDGVTWSNLENSGSTTSVNSGEKILFKASGLTPNGSDGIGTLAPSANASVQGNIMSLLYGDDFSGQTTITNQDQFRGLFYQCTHITSAEHLILPATTLANNCYQSMFWGCSYLTTAPVLPATTLVSSCYRYMFYECYSLNYIKCLARDKSAMYCTSQWVVDVASSGTFVKAASMRNWTTGNDGIPTGWVVENEGDLPYNAQYLTIESLEDNNTISLVTTNTATTRTISASTDNGATWTAYTSTTGGRQIASLNTGQKVLLKGLNTQYATTITSRSQKNNYFTSAGQFNVYGNIMSLVSGDSFDNADTLTATYTFGGLFSGCTGLIYAENLILPATTLTDYCYKYMFYGCTNLTTAPELPATTLASHCYDRMFDGCTNLTTAPELPATTLTDYCYVNMFNDCTNLNYIKCLATTFGNLSVSNWVSGVASTGTFVKAASMNDWAYGGGGIPEGWTVENDDGSPVGGGDWDQ